MKPLNTSVKQTLNLLQSSSKSPKAAGQSLSPKVAWENGTLLLKKMKDFDEHTEIPGLPPFVKELVQYGSVLHPDLVEAPKKPAEPLAEKPETQLAVPPSAKQQAPKTSAAGLFGLMMGLSAASALSDGALIGAAVGMVAGSVWVLLHRDPQKTYVHQLAQFVGRSAGLGALMLGALRFIAVDFPLLAIAAGICHVSRGACSGAAAVASAAASAAQAAARYGCEALSKCRPEIEIWLG